MPVIQSFWMSPRRTFSTLQPFLGTFVTVFPSIAWLGRPHLPFFCVKPLALWSPPTAFSRIQSRVGLGAVFLQGGPPPPSAPAIFASSGGPALAAQTEPKVPSASLTPCRDVLNEQLFQATLGLRLAFQARESHYLHSMGLKLESADLSLCLE